MDGKTIIQGLILILVVSLAFASIYAAETGEVSHSDSSNGQNHLYISGSGDVAHVVTSADPVHAYHDLPTVNV